MIDFQMGFCCCSFCPFRRRKNIKLAVLGLDNAGKSSVVNQIMGDYQALVTPTLGFSSNTTTFGRMCMTIFDLGGSGTIRKYWSNYYHELHGVIFVIDSSDLQRLDESRIALHEALKDAKVAGKPILILANKQDLPDHLTADEISKNLDMGALVQTPYHIKGCVAYAEKRITPDVSIIEGLQWLEKVVSEHYDELYKRTQRDTTEWTKQEAEKKNQQIARVAAIKAERESVQLLEDIPQTSNIPEPAKSITIEDPLLPGQLQTDSST